MFEVIITKEELYDKCENVEQLYDKFYYPLLVEYKELKKQVEEYENEPLTNKISRIDCVLSKIYSQNKTQQQEFIKYLEDETKEVEKTIEMLSDTNSCRIPNLKYKGNTLKEILQKYKEIIGENDV